MTDHDHDDDEKPGICFNCMAERVAGNVLSEFTELHPDVKMSYSQWMELGFLIEEEIKTALGINEPEDENHPEPGTLVQ